MANVTIRRYGEISRGVFAILLDKPDGLQVKEVLREVEARVPPTPFEQENYPTVSGCTRDTSGSRRSA